MRSLLTLLSADATDAAKFVKIIEDRWQAVEPRQLFELEDKVLSHAAGAFWPFCTADVRAGVEQLRGCVRLCEH